jgi:SAM-dependent methyltransferase
VLVAGTAEIDWFLSSGKAQADYLRRLLSEASRPLEGMDAILDFGCGSGRIARWFADLPGPRFNGCDYNSELVDWCNANLGFMHARKTDLQPPLPYADDSFDFLYAFSVFTHLSVQLAERWMGELARVVKPGGLVWFTIHGESYRERLLPEEQTRFDAGEIVVWLPEIEGTNLCGAYWPSGSVESMLGSDFEILVHLDPRADPTTAEDAQLTHDAYLVRRL